MDALRVFIVDDDQDFAESLALLIEGRGYQVEVAFSGEEAIAKFREQDFDITFMDVRLPGKNGTESFLEIRKFKPSARVVMMTGYSVEQLLEQAVEHGAWGVLGKPIDVHQLLEMLERIKPDGILVVDDDADFVESIRNLLVGEGYTVFVATNGQAAVDRIRSNGVDILILDLRLPILSGLETYLELKRIGCAVPTLIVTAYFDDYTDDVNKLQSLSVSGILRKPFDPRDLLNAVEYLARTGKGKHNAE
ncbi:MAG: response regulator [Anaerolineae bacterium]|jgi:two-component system response regulator HydG